MADTTPTSKMQFHVIRRYMLRLVPHSTIPRDVELSYPIMVPHGHKHELERGARLEARMSQMFKHPSHEQRSDDLYLRPV